ncbi:hypothetical protein [Demequina soli]|uniref:hypothetical protein n=1 Tax=Demequina soli TaxID=1638987 RepID=UPI000780320C|nr:hypothetical protein [Demequina soli]
MPVTDSGTLSPAAGAVHQVADRYDAIYSCMVDRGLPITIENGGYSYDNTVLDQGTIDATFDTCESELMSSGEIGADPLDDPAYLSAVFDDLLVQAECLVSHGYPVDEPPSREAWIDSKGAVWSPFDAVADGTVETLAEAESACL